MLDCYAEIYAAIEAGWDFLVLDFSGKYVSLQDYASRDYNVREAVYEAAAQMVLSWSNEERLRAWRAWQEAGRDE